MQAQLSLGLDNALSDLAPATPAQEPVYRTVGLDTPLQNRLYYRCYDCLSMMCIERDYSQRYQKLQCGICGGYLEFIGHVTGTGWQKKVTVCDCDERCVSATGPHCTCKCGGENHGSRMAYHEEITASGVVKITPADDQDAAHARAAEYRAADAAAIERIKAKVGPANMTGYVQDKTIWRMREDMLYQLRVARTARQHKLRLKKLAAIANQ